MVYCTKCTKPSSLDSGTCPHCGSDLSSEQVEVQPPKEMNRSESGSDSIPFLDPFQSIASELGSAPPPISGLELETLPPGTQASGKVGPWAKEKNEDFEAKVLGKFGEAEQGAVGSIKYWMKVRQRLKDLDVEERKAARTSKLKADKFLKLRAELGRKAFDLKLTDGEIGKLIEKAIKSEGASKGAARRTESTSAWADVGDWILKSKPDIPELKPLKKQVQEAKKNVDEAEHKVDLFKRARESYDRHVVEDAQRLMKVWSICLAIFLIVIIFFALIS